jgi:mono/diheme cytochrome c family protein
MIRKTFFTGIVVAVLVGLIAYVAQPARAAPLNQDDPVARGKYLTTIAGCVDCHTPYPANTDPTQIKDLDQLYSYAAGPDKTRLFAGGQPFPVPGLGIVFSKNLTSDKETGLGNWTDDEIKTAFQTGVSKDGLHLFPIMPYHFFNGMADSDADAIVAFLRTLPAVNNPVPRQQLLPVEVLPQLPKQSGIVSPAPSDSAARGKYLMTAVIPCSDCHTPADPTTGAPIMAKYLSGGQPFEGPWGIIYGGNITPDKETGIGNWTDAELKNFLRTGVMPESQKRRHAVIMPWQLWASLTDDDLNAIVYYLRHDVPAVANAVPAPALKPGFEQFAPAPAAQPSGPSTGLIIAIGVAVVALGGGGVYLFMRNRRKQ